MADRYKASIDDMFFFECETLEDSFEKVIVRHEFPFRAGALLQDMGQTARDIKIRLYFMNENYEAHKKLIAHLDAVDHTYELSHPKYGLIKGHIATMVVRHDDRLETAEIDLSFIEGKIPADSDAGYAAPVDAGTEEAFIAGQDELNAHVAADIKEQYPDDFNELLKEIDPAAANLFEQYAGLTRQAQAFVKKVDQYVGRLRATLNEITAPANSLVSTIIYARNLPGVLIGSIAAAVERFVLLYDSLRDAPDRFLDSYRSGAAQLEDAAEFRKYARISIAQREVVEIGAILKEDQNKDNAARQAARTKTFSVTGRPQKEIAPAPQLLTITEIENTLAIVRADLQAAINEARSMQTLKAMAAALTDHVIAIKKTKPAPMTVVLDNPLPLHLVCLRYGLAYHDAEQLLAINRLRHPSFAWGEVQIYV
ncbi:MAG TPA: DNA circularization N-terminal domain-containing protein [Smithellaceae bacterium]|jgi:prophage DNA circulation protein|nr:MAG: hypothetical protein BWY90_00096 [Deltaproteobacteria bacterium ADurb.BinA014]HOF77244.1 DNA circularization N-terminal domain-containing protein [Smithellaceae bacterium]HOS08356.1 DNA circularization N-terminal domain-containing protein [Smithellaceae bacterium]HOU03723.1 DNA circularization N-terminal domain-containing protein [Smithellaceae bacterium]HOZ61614.1 DNA circularization N-terminal domain-containing protein [Smithellaceae bacterium]